MKSWRPEIPLQTDTFGCGYVCASALMAMYGHNVSVPKIKEFWGDTSRGLKVSDLVTIIRHYGFVVDILKIDPASASAYATPCVVLFGHGHFAVVGKRTGNSVDLLRPESGWRKEKLQRLSRTLSPYAIAIVDIGAAAQNDSAKKKVAPFFQAALAHLRSGAGLRLWLFTLAALCFQLVVPLFTQKSIDALVSGTGMTASASIAIIVVALTLVSAFSNWLSIVGIQRQVGRLSVSTAGWLFDRLAARSPSALEQYAPSYAFDQLTALNAINNFYVELMFRVTTVVAMGIAGLVATVYVSPVLVIPGILGVAFSFLLNQAFMNSSQVASMDAQRSSIKLRTFALDVVSQLPLFVRFGSETHVRAKFRQAAAKVAYAQQATSRVQSARGSLASVFSVLDHFIFASVAAYFVGLDRLSLGTFVALGLYKDLLAMALMGCVQLTRQYSVLLPQRLQVVELFDQRDVAVNTKTEIGTAANDYVLQFENVTFYYPTEQLPALTSVNLHISAGELVVLYGPSGAGKSTLVKLACGFAEPQFGQVTLFGRPPALGCRDVAVAMQSDRLLADSIRQNVCAYRRQITDDEIYAALDIVDLGDFVRNLPMRLDTLIGVGVPGLSGGQQQRVLLARALVGHPTLLVLDEAMSNLDQTTENAIITKLLARKITVLLCSHRLEVRYLANRVYECSNQKISLINYSEKLTRQ